MTTYAALGLYDYLCMLKHLFRSYKINNSGPVEKCATNWCHEGLDWGEVAEEVGTVYHGIIWFKKRH